METFAILFLIAMILFVVQSARLEIRTRMMRTQHAVDIEQRVQDYNTLFSQKKSSEVRLGYIAEKLAPFLEVFPPDAQESDIVSLGMPIDYMVFGDEHIDFIEVKTGASRLSHKQRHIKRLVQGGRVRWFEVRIK